MRCKLAVAAAFLAAALTLSACSGTPAAGGGDYPADDITFIVPYPAGSAPDSSARAVAKEMEGDLGVSVIVENVEGGASTVGLYQLAGADPDGYTIGWGTSSGIAVQSRLVDNPFEGIDSLTPISRVNLVPNVLFASPDKGWKSIDDFIAAAKAKPGKLTVGLGNRGSTQDIAVALLERSAGIDLKPVYFDAGEMVLPAANGTIDSAVAQFGPVTQYVQKGDLAYIGAIGGQAPEGVDVPSFDDAGYDTSYFPGWEGLFGPADLPEEVVKRLDESVRKAVGSSSYQQFITKVYGLPGYLGHAEFAKLAADDYRERGPKIINDMGLAKK